MMRAGWWQPVLPSQRATSQVPGHLELSRCDAPQASQHPATRPESSSPFPLRNPIFEDAPLPLPSLPPIIQSAIRAPKHKVQVSPQARRVQVPQPKQQCSHCSYSFALSLFSAWPGLRPARSCTGTCLAQLAPHRTSTSTSTPTYSYPGTAAAATTTAGLCYAPLGDPSIFLSFVSCPPLFFSFNLFSTLICSTQNTLLSLTYGPQHSISSSYYVLSTRPSFSKRSIPPHRRGATAQPFLRLDPSSGFDRFVDTLFAITIRKLFHLTTPTTHACDNLLVFSCFQDDRGV
ncbi:hypothetical protein CSIM01_02502 [Colletotrichum simmondsii]|uniref:Uncharacterized protein n=1 Tax=Colletotrichum simmondsii TaxID=703756 RepID=A0A135S7Q6_9PEZI|nr:hypothetical protein CSIM01_02502 [Colletotrichum simmondsii]